MRNILVVSHADADGHVIAEQVRRNLELVPTFNVTTLVDAVRTKDHKTWTKLDEISEIEQFDIVFFVDLMFAPSSFVAEADALVSFVAERPTKTFFVLDHHPLPMRLLGRAKNLHAQYQRDVVDCTFGSPSWMMAIAALLEKQPTRVTGYTQDHKDLAEGIRRAAAPGGPLPGEKLSALLRFEYWGELIALGRDDKQNHYLPRGRRPSRWKISEPLRSLDELATKLVAGNRVTNTKARSVMSYDLEIAPDRIPPKASLGKQRASSPVQGTDLEAIVMLLELAAISLTSAPDVRFTRQQLLEQARIIGGDDIVLDEADVDIVLDKAAFLVKEKQKKYRLK